MQRVVFLLSRLDQFEDGNALRLPNALLARGFEVWFACADSLGLVDNEVTLLAAHVATPVIEGDYFDNLELWATRDFDAIWVLSLGTRASFLDKYQLLYLAAQSSRVINSLDAIMHLKSKYFLAGQDPINYPETHAGSDPEALMAIVRQGGYWIAKPPAGSLGREVFRLHADDSNSEVILATLCGVDADNYVLLQREVPEIAAGEKRVLFAAGEVVGQYLRHRGDSHRTNLSQGGTASACELTAEERDYCMRLGAFLVAMGADFVGLDLAYPWVIEFNVINPGGLTTIAELTGADLSRPVVERIFPAA